MKLCLHIHDSKKRCYCTPSRVEPLLVCIWDKEKGVVYDLPPLKEITTDSRSSKYSSSSAATSIFQLSANSLYFTTC